MIQPMTEAGELAFIARQPIFDRDRRVAGYELLFRSSMDNRFDGSDAESATARTMHNSLCVHGLGHLTRGRPAYVNLGRGLLLEHAYRVFPRELLVVELLEHVEPDDEVIEACRQLKADGYRLALDDFVFAEGYRPLLALADIVKIDVMAEGEHEAVRNCKATLLAEKIETYQGFREAAAGGYELFQGYFFARPQVLASRDVPKHKRAHMELLRALASDELEMDRIEAIIQQDVGLSVRLLRYLNSVSMGLGHRIESIRHALTMMGERPLRQWASLVAVGVLADDKPSELMVVSLVRARFGELLAEAAGMGPRAFEMFLMGLLASADAMLECPMDEVIDHLALPADVAETLLGQETGLRPAYQLMLMMERGRFKSVPRLASELGVSEKQVAQAYEQARQWAEQLGTPAAR